MKCGEMNNLFCLDSELLQRLYNRYTSALSALHLSSHEELRKYFPSEAPPLECFGAWIEVSFWASLKKEEGRYHDFSLVLSQAERLDNFFAFEEPLPFTVEILAKLAPALDASETQIGVWLNEENQLFVWGFDPDFNISPKLKTFAPGRLLFSFLGPKGFYALITGSGIKFIDKSRSRLIEMLVEKLKSLSDYRREIAKAHRIEILLKHRAGITATLLEEIARVMRSHAHGGILLVVPNNESWKKSIHRPIKFTGSPYEKVKEHVKRWIGAMQKKENQDIFPANKYEAEDLDEYNAAKEIANQSLKLIGQLTAIDGATVIRYDLTVLAFGAKIKPIDSNKKPEKVLVSEPFEDSLEEEIELADLGGTRHQSAAQFVFDQKDSIAIVASQDGRLSVLAWEPEKQRVAVTRHAEFALL